MKIADFEIVDRCLFLAKEKILVVGDLHLGYEEYLMAVSYTHLTLPTKRIV